MFMCMYYHHQIEAGTSVFMYKFYVSFWSCFLESGNLLIKIIVQRHITEYFILNSNRICSLSHTHIHTMDNTYLSFCIHDGIQTDKKIYLISKKKPLTLTSVILQPNSVQPTLRAWERNSFLLTVE